MSTRAQIYVRGGLNDDHIMIYHHCDGYPEGVIPELKAAWNTAEEIKTFKAHRGGYAASIILHEMFDPEYGPSAEPETGLELHGDIEFLYVVTMNEPGPWQVAAYYVESEPVLDVKKAIAGRTGLRLLGEGPITVLSGAVLQELAWPEEKIQ